MWSSDVEDVDDDELLAEWGLHTDEARQRYWMTRTRRSSSSSMVEVEILEEDEIIGISTELCVVCLENDVMEFACRPCCHQPICHTCMKTYVTSKLEIGVVRIGCPNAECEGLVQVEELTTLDDQLVRLYHRRLIDANSDPRRKTCPNCCLITEVRRDDHEASKYGLLINCTECQFLWCFRCHAPQHQGVTCDKNRVPDDLLVKWAHRKRTKNVPTAQQCPICKVFNFQIIFCICIHSTSDVHKARSAKAKATPPRPRPRPHSPRTKATESQSKALKPRSRSAFSGVRPRPQTSRL